MVYENSGGLSARAFILEELRGEAGGVVSGEALGKRLGVSRVAVWKQVKALAAAGYPVEEAGRGYRLRETGAGDFLFPWEFGGREGFFRHWESTDSTMDRAAELAGRGAPGGTVITAEVQTAGRGRNGRNWVSRRGGLFFTLLERPGLPAAEYPFLALKIHLALGRALRAFCGGELCLRWPNDVYAGGRKIAGFLTEFYAAGDRISWLAAGVGINVNNRPPPGTGASCAELLGRPLSRRELLLRFLEELRLLAGLSGGELPRRWNREAGGIGREVLVLGGGEGAAEGRHPAVRGRGAFLGVDAAGRGLVREEGRRGTAAYSPAEASFRFVNT
jgi:BirA family biotin operon repressor/biotin-[acetyl-CoA-carboxylase] ligase